MALSKRGQRLPEGHWHYHLDRMLTLLVRQGKVACCGTCMDARGLEEEMLVEGARRSTLEGLTDCAVAERTLTF